LKFWGRNQHRTWQSLKDQILTSLPQFSHSSIHDWYSLLAWSMHILSMSASAGSSYWSLHDSTSDSYSSRQSDLQPAIDRRLNPKIINTKIERIIIHFLVIISPLSILIQVYK
jgi:hypothetical protein